MFDKDEKLGGRLITEDDMICVNCVFKGFPEGMPPTKCMIYPNGKPMDVIGRAKNVTCPAYKSEEDI